MSQYEQDSSLDDSIDSSLDDPVVRGGSIDFSMDDGFVNAAQNGRSRRIDSGTLVFAGFCKCLFGIEILVFERIAIKSMLDGKLFGELERPAVFRQIDLGILILKVLIQNHGLFGV